MTVIGFDLDMTLVDSADAIVDSIRHTCRAHGVEIDEAAVRAGVGLPLDRVFPDLIPDVPYAEALEVYRARYLSHGLAMQTLLPGAREALQVVTDDGCSVLVVSAKKDTHVRAVLDEVGLSHLVRDIVGERFAETKADALRERGAGSTSATTWATSWERRGWRGRGRRRHRADQPRGARLAGADVVAGRPHRLRRVVAAVAGEPGHVETSQHAGARMRILVIGGTRFVGRHIVDAALRRGHDVTLLHRGRSGDDLFPEAEHLHADRDGDLALLAGRELDATIDSLGLPACPGALAADALGGRGGRYLVISSTSVYAEPDGPGFDEDVADGRRRGGRRRRGHNDTYGPLKVSIERLARETFGDAATVVRPTYVIGPWDYTRRFTSWVQRIAAGGEVLAPGNPDDPIQVVDGRDLGAFCVRLVEGDIAGHLPRGHARSRRTPSATCSPTSRRWRGRRARRSPGSTRTGCSTRASATRRSRCGAAATRGSVPTPRARARSRAAGLPARSVPPDVASCSSTCSSCPLRATVRDDARTRDRAARRLARAVTAAGAVGPGARASRLGRSPGTVAWGRRPGCGPAYEGDEGRVRRCLPARSSGTTVRRASASSRPRRATRSSCTPPRCPPAWRR